MTSFGSAIDDILAGNYEIDRRMMLNGRIFRKGQQIYENTALNDIVINRCGNLRVIDFDIYVNDQYLSSYSADGVIVSTADRLDSVQPFSRWTDYTAECGTYDADTYMSSYA